jgi:DNA invertase Pin-like site-specific DNA recombinase
MSLRAFCIVLLPCGIGPGWLRRWKPSVALVVLDQAIDTSTSAGRLPFNVLGSIAEFERDLIRERTRCGMAAVKWRGKRVGRRLLLGFIAETAWGPTPPPSRMDES